MNRRESLAAIAGVAVTLSGCAGFGSSSGSVTSSPTASEGTVSDGPSSGSSRDPALLRRRSEGSRPPILFGEQDGTDSGRPNASERRRVLDSTVIDTASRADRLSVAAGIDRTEVDAFVAATDFATETLYLEQAEVGECFRLHLCRIAWQPDQVSTDYGRQTRPYSERCAVDQRVFEARLIRIPDSLDADTVHSFSRSIGTASCGEDGMGAAGARGSGSSSRSGSGTSGEPTTTASEMDSTPTAGDR